MASPMVVVDFDMVVSVERVKTSKEMLIEVARLKRPENVDISKSKGMKRPYIRWMSASQTPHRCFGARGIQRASAFTRPIHPVE